ncbi:MAG: phosphotransacetylase family protein [Cyanobacteria bacterium M_surface_7_m2_040]|nr:phosphotransacetylase family protein [Cyanobacteria bacterium M_surface_7_m2_040]
MASTLPTTLLLGSCEAFGGKSAVVLGLIRQLVAAGADVHYGKPLATSLESRAGDPALIDDALLIDDDVQFVGTTLHLPASRLLPSLHVLSAASAQQRLLSGSGASEPDGALAAVRRQLEALPSEATVVLEGAGTLAEGLLYGLSLVQLARGLEAPVLLVHPWSDARSVEPLLQARVELGSLLAGVVLNGVEPDQVAAIRAEIGPALARQGIPLLGVLPRSPLLRSVTVDELVARLEARVLCCQDRLDLLVETLSIGAMNVNAAMEFFRRRRNMAVVTGADRTDIQLAALEASTQCLILTGVGEPLPQLINRAEELEVPLLRVDHDTLTTVEVIERAFGHVRLHEGVKATYAIRLVEEHCGFAPLLERLRLPLPA